jgi:hypothetical protein
MKGGPGTPGYKAQNNTQTVFVDPDSVVRFQTELIAEHMIARDQESQLVTDPAMRQRKLPIEHLNSPVAAQPPAERLPRPSEATTSGPPPSPPASPPGQ